MTPDAPRDPPGNAPKGDVLGVARTAGILAASVRRS